MKNTLVICFLLISGFVTAQKVTISAKVVDKETKEPLIFATIGILGKPIGTITNMQGDFDFYVPAEYRNENLVISILGYENFQAPVWTVLDNKNPIIEMEKSTTVLEEVVVTDSLQGGEVLNIALSRIEQNYPMTPYLVDGFYRDIKKVGGVYISLLEAAVKIYDEDYMAPRNKFKLRERVALLEVRRSLGYSSKFTAYFDEDNLLEDLLLHNNVRYRQFPEEEAFFTSLGREKDSHYNGHDIFVVSYNKEYRLVIYIDKKNYSIIHLEYENGQQETIGKRRGLVSKFVNLKRVIDFKEYDQKLYLNFIAVDSKIHWYDATTGELKFETEVHQQLLINDINPSPEERIGTTEKMRSYGLQFQDLPYNKAFWKNYNVIKESPLDAKIIEDLEKEETLEKQFEKN
ncbi:MAG: carboxypeptidase-like regulatory domain-containing protein [Bacteroidota bacterium]